AEHKLSLDQPVEIPRYDVVTGVSPIAERWPQQKTYRLGEMVELMVAKSDNTAVQTLFRMAGGAEGMRSRMAAWHIAGVRVDRDERTCGLTAMGVRQIPPQDQWTPEMADALTQKIPPERRRAALLQFVKDPRDTGTPLASVDLLHR